MNIKFCYLYRDGGNYKNWGSVIFENPNNEAPDVLQLHAIGFLIQGLWFDANIARVSDLHFSDFDADLDHSWHEFEAFELTEEQASDPMKRTIDQFMIDLCAATDELATARSLCGTHAKL